MLYFEPPRERAWMIPAIITAIMIYASREAVGYGLAGLGMLLMIVAVAVFAPAAIVNCIHWLVYNVAAQIRQVITAKAETETVLILREWGKLTEYQVHGYEVLQPTLRVFPGNRGAIPTVMMLSGVDIPYGFIVEFLAQEGAYLTPVGLYAEGTKQRQWAQHITAYLIKQGFAERAAGNHSARWTDRPGGEQFLHYDRIKDLVME